MFASPILAQRATPPPLPTADYAALEVCPPAMDAYAATTALAAARAAAARADYGDAVRLSSCALRSAAPPEQAAAYHERGQAYLRLQAYDRAILDFDAALRLDPLAAHTSLLRGQAHYSSAQFEAALRDFARALAIHPNDPRAYNSRGLVRVALHQLDLARADYTRAIALGHDPLTAPLFNRARLFTLMSDDLAAAADYERLLALDPTFSPAYRRLADVYTRLGREDDAQRLLMALEDLLSPLPASSTPPRPALSLHEQWVRLLPLLVIAAAVLYGTGFTGWRAWRISQP